MPELPEAETIVRDLRGRLPGSTVTRVSVKHADVLHRGLTPRALDGRLRGRTFTGVSRRGKNVVLEFDGGHRLVINLGMTGRVVTSDAARAGELRHVAVTLHLDDGRAVLYDDARRFGDLDLRDEAGWAQRTAELGVEPLSDDFTAERLHQLTRTSITPIRNWLLDQRRVAGVGNIYAVEALFRAGIRPTRRAKTLRRRETTLLRDTLRDVLQESIDARGTTISDYRDASGERGGFDRRLRVYDRTGAPCLECGSLIKRVVLSNRSAFYCPSCQT
ncbi:MAG TPA: bifunctional DNA-formamidopyrimidine glycosylase/DNA-(apurinic or apyrimidinic site) lyase [Longimicrobiales bacterium]|nr:bifunctional DNA-formamidopyrimidine glycosylase/DNA-(apurinic or apyrimidinic site) lyase [Longimicrobiales bacterium]